jgi:hypothetical protein
MTNALAGIEFAKRVKRSPGLLESLKAGFRVADYVPQIDGLSDGLSAEKFRDAYGGLEDEKFRAAYDEVRKRVLGLGAYAGEK